MKKILIASTQYPYYGGSATNTYALIKFFRKNGYETAGLFFTNDKDNEDPDNIDGVFKISDYTILSENQPESIIKRIYKYLKGEPDIILGKNYKAPIYLKRMFPNKLVTYLVSGSPIMIEAAEENISAIKYLNSNETLVDVKEIKCAEMSDFMIPNNPIGYMFLQKKYGNIKKILNPVDTSFATNINNITKKPFIKRKYDICFICSKFTRKVKNIDLVIKIMKSSNFINSKKVVIGANNECFTENKINNIEIFGRVHDNKKILNIFNESKVVLCTSYYDASSNVIKEGIICGCNILMSKNCGWWEKYPKEFVCEDIYDIEEWIQKLEYLIENDVTFSHDIEKEQKKIINGICLR